jgi:hypothetical protein
MFSSFMTMQNGGKINALHNNDAAFNPESDNVSTKAFLIISNIILVMCFVLYCMLLDIVNDLHVQ